MMGLQGGSDCSRRRDQLPKVSMALSGFSVSSRTRLGMALLVLACFLQGLALSMPVWENDHGDSYSSLWWVCLGAKCISTLSISMKVWFHAVQALMISCSVTLMAALISAGVHIFALSLEKKKRRTAVITSSIVLAAAIQSLTAVLTYGFGQVPYPDYFYTLSWGFYLALIGTILLFASAFVFFREGHRLANRAIDKRPILRHSNSITSEICFSMTSTPAAVTQRSRSDSEVRLRTSSLSCSTPLPDDLPNSPNLKGITEVFSHEMPP